MMKSPLLIGGDLPTLDPDTLSVLTCREALSVHRDGFQGRQLWRSGDAQVCWETRMPDDGKAMAFFNLDEIPWILRFSARISSDGVWRTIHDIWGGCVVMPDKDGGIETKIAPHGCAFFRES
jgi:hypothetical protein